MISEKQLQEFFDRCEKEGLRARTIVGFAKHNLVTVYVPGYGEYFANDYDQMFQKCFDCHDEREIEIAKELGLI